MRGKLVLVMTWLLAVLVASSIGFFAIGLIGDVLRDRGPIGVSPGELQGRPTDSPRTGVPIRERFDYDAGTVTVECTGASAVLVDAVARDGWEVATTEPGPDEDVDVAFRRGAEVFEIEVYCNEGHPRAVVGQ